MDVTRLYITIASFLVGIILGSFACCQAWRLRLKQLGKKSPGKRSVCLSCGKRLSVKENIPIFSWIAQRGKCKKCGASIGKAEILSELGMGIVFAAIGWTFYPDLILVLANLTFPNVIIYPLALVSFLVTVVVLWSALVYDAKWQELPVRLLVIANISAALIVVLSIINMFFDQTISVDLVPYLLNLLGSVGILAGIYFLLYFASREKLVGSGDWLLALPIALILASPILAVFVLFLSNFAASIYGVAKRIHTKEKNLKIPFGPFLVLAFLIIFLFQNELNQLIFMF